MISVIIASVNEAYRNAIERNIKATIGVPYELLIVPNHTNPTGLSKLYNRMAAEAAYDYLVFAHEDLEFHTQGWGEKLLRHLQEPGTGAVGLAGPLYYPSLPVPILSDDKARVLYMLQSSGPEDKEASLHCDNPRGVDVQQVAAIDGCFIAVSKKLWQQYPFNEELLHGFHFYDLDFTLRLSLNGLKNKVFFDILIAHFSRGRYLTYNRGWFREGELFWQHWKGLLPYYVETPARRQVKKDYWKCLFHYCWNVQQAGMGKKYLLQQFRKFAFRRRYFSAGMVLLTILQPVYHRLHRRYPDLFTRKEIFS